MLVNFIGILNSIYKLNFVYKPIRGKSDSKYGLYELLDQIRSADQKRYLTQQQHRKVLLLLSTMY
jgi:hypothetical protein